MNISIIALTLSNLIPLFGVMFLGWSVFEVMFVYWCENVVVGFWNVIKMFTAKRGESDSLGAIVFCACFFTFHYGLFCFGHGIFVFVLFRADFSNGDLVFSQEPITYMVVFAALALFVSHGVSYFTNFIGKKEYLKPGNLMAAPYGRMMMLHVALVIGGGAVITLNSPFLVLTLLVIFKIVFDIKAHRKAHLKLQQEKRRDAALAEKKQMAE